MKQSEPPEATQPAPISTDFSRTTGAAPLAMRGVNGSDRVVSQRQALQAVRASPLMAVQRQAVQSVLNSPRMVAQRATFAKMTGGAQPDVAINDERALEQEADSMGARALQLAASSANEPARAPLMPARGESHGSIQRMEGLAPATKRAWDEPTLDSLKRAVELHYLRYVISNPKERLVKLALTVEHCNGDEFEPIVSYANELVAGELALPGDISSQEVELLELALKVPDAKRYLTQKFVNPLERLLLGQIYDHFLADATAAALQSAADLSRDRDKFKTYNSKISGRKLLEKRRKAPAKAAPTLKEKQTEPLKDIDALLADLGLDEKRSASTKQGSGKGSAKNADKSKRGDPPGGKTKPVDGPKIKEKKVPSTSSRDDTPILSGLPPQADSSTPKLTPTPRKSVQPPVPRGVKRRDDKDPADALRQFEIGLKQAMTQEGEERLFQLLAPYVDVNARRELLKQQMVPMDVHTHLVGILTVDDLVSMGFGKDYTSPAVKLLDAYRRSEDEHGDTERNRRILHAFPDEYIDASNAKGILDTVLTAGTLSYDDAYPARGRLINIIVEDHGPEVYWGGILGRLAKDGIRYAEIKVSDHDWPKALRGIAPDTLRDLCGQHGVKIRFLVSASTDQNLVKGRPVHEREGLTGALSLDDRFADMVSGVDVSGPEEQHFTPVGAEQLMLLYSMVASAAEAHGRPMVLAPHVGEGVASPGGKHMQIARDNIQFVLDTLRHIGKSEKVIVRLGHVTHPSAGSAKLMSELGAYAEVNISSNLVTGSISSLKEHSLLLLLFYQVPTLVCTDGQGVVRTSLLREYRLADVIISLFKAGGLKVRLDSKDGDGFQKIGSSSEAEFTYAELCDFHGKPAMDHRFDVQRLIEWGNVYAKTIGEEATVAKPEQKPDPGRKSEM